MSVSGKKRLASALLALGDVPHEHAKAMTSDQIISLYEWDHYPIPRAEGGPDEAWNLVPRLKSAHALKTKSDIARIAKNKRIAAKHELHLARMRLKDG